MYSRAYTGDEGLTLVEYTPFGIVAAVTPSNNLAVIAKEIGIEVPASTRLLWGKVPEDHPFIWIEQLMPILPISFVKDVDSAIDLAYRAEGGNHHTASMYSTHVGNLTRMGRRMQCSIFVKNAATLYGLGMGVEYVSMSIGTPTGDGLTRTSHYIVVL